ncbi:hypothetical protein [Kitasatospora sp. NBC_01266]|uniref:hypothetical protein n=1 Tax=Kitasatospora sp. NBC_01266 TaxID=2903572 RepID=UPI002E2FB33B|nr:hypothetical protein [Kitasatospora sp. NBC_01266]
MVEPVINGVVRALLITLDPAFSGRVRELWEAMRVIAMTGYGLFVLATGLTVMTHGSVQQRWSAQELLPRLVLGIAASNLSLTLCSTMLTLANALTVAIFGNGVSADDVAGTLIGLILAQVTNTGAPYMLVIQLVALTLAGTLLVTALMRTAGIVLLTVGSALMLACHGHPASDGIARLWWRAYLGCLGTQIVQALALLVCVKALLDPGNYGLVPITKSTPLVNLMLICCTLYLLIKIPSWIRRIVTTPARNITGNTGPRVPGMRILRKIAIGAALGSPFGPYAFGAALGGRARAAWKVGRAATPGRGAGGGTPRYRWGPPRRGGPGPGRPGRPGGPGGGRPGAGPGGPRRGGPSPTTAGPGPSAAPTPSYQWGRPRRNAPRKQTLPPPSPSLPPAGVTPPGNRPGPTGPQPGTGGPGSPPPKPGPTSSPPPAVRPTAAANLRPARVNLPPPIPRPAPLRPPLDDGPPNSRRGRS